ncbi:MAG: B12-binding domain-containing radical SAM protein, partial [Anaerovorax sp.]
MSVKEQLDKLLMKIEKPARYIGGELNSVQKDLTPISTRFGFAFPDTYEIGMSYLGLQIIYHTL